MDKKNKSKKKKTNRKNKTVKQQNQYSLRLTWNLKKYDLFRLAFICFLNALALIVS